jgi:hypothetical protein
MSEQRTDLPTRLVIFHRKGSFYPISVYWDDTREQLQEHAALNPGTLKITDAATGDILWQPQ